jgi:hypothetical protein
MREMKTLLIIAFLSLGALPAQPTDTSPPQTLSSRILAEPSLSTKQELGRRLGRLATPAAQEALLKLLDAESYWDRLAAVAGLAGSKDPVVIAALVGKITRDHMIRDAIRTLALSDAPTFTPALIAAWEEETADRGRKELLSILGKMKMAEAARFLERRARDPGETLAHDALRALVTERPEQVAVARELCERPALRNTALSLVQSYGAPADLALFRPVLADTNERDEARVIACQAIARWGAQDLRVASCLAVLRQEREVLTQGALVSFRDLADPAIVDESCRLSRRAILQRTRLLAVDHLLGLHKPQAIPFLIEALGETWSPETGAVGLEIAASVLTVGISSIFDKLNASSSKKEFLARQERIVATLAKDTGAWPGKTREAWRDWAIYAGHTVGGANLIQWLFSGYPEKRQRALEASARLLGHRDLDALLRARPQWRGLPEAALRLELARALQEAGVLRDERW